MPYRVKYKEGALRDIVAISVYGEKEWGIVRSREYLSALRDTCESLSELPLRGFSVDQTLDVRGLQHGAHIILYRVKGQSVEIGLIVHQKSNYANLINAVRDD